MVKSFSFYILLLVFLALISCNSGAIFNQTYEIENAKWNTEDTLVFEVNISDTSALYDVYIDISNTLQYSFSNLWMFVKIYPPNGEKTILLQEFFLADARGEWIGGGWGSSRNNRILFRSSILFPKIGKYVIVLEQGMRTSSLRNIEKVGLSIEKL